MMAGAEISNKEKWEKAHKALSHALEKEIALMRELLANLHQEELSLLEVDSPRWADVMNERSEMIVQLGNIRSGRVDATQILEELAKEMNRSELLAADEEASCEILSKLDQEVALVERINLQNCRNDALFDQARQKEELPLHCSYPHPLHQTKKKPTLTTYTKKH